MPYIQHEEDHQRGLYLFDVGHYTNVLNKT